MKNPYKKLSIFICMIMLCSSLTSYAQQTKNKESKTSLTEKIPFNPEVKKGVLSNGTKFHLNIPADDENIIALIVANVSDFSVVPPHTFWTQFFFSFMPILIFIFFIWFISSRFTKSWAKAAGPLAKSSRNAAIERNFFQYI